LHRAGIVNPNVHRLASAEVGTSSHTDQRADQLQSGQLPSQFLPVLCPAAAVDLLSPRHLEPPVASYAAGAAGGPVLRPARRVGKEIQCPCRQRPPRRRDAAMPAGSFHHGKPEPELLL
jgi:hypothetical protein